MIGVTCRIMAKQRSQVREAARRYWHWLGALLAEWSNDLGRRRHRFFVFGGCLAWVVFGIVYLLAVSLLLTFVAAIVAVLTLVGVLLSAAGGLDQLRVNASRRDEAPDHEGRAHVG